jgi:hypothetical protein
VADSTEQDDKGEVVQRSSKPHDGKNTKRPAPDGEAKKVRELYQLGVKATRQETSNYWINYAFLQGAQWVYWDENANRIAELPRDPDRTRITNNRMASNTRTIMSKAMQRRMVFEVLPSASDDASIRGGRLGENILREVHRHHDWEVLREKHLQAIWKGGTAAICVNWNPDAKDEIIPASDDGEAAVHEGDTYEEVLSIAEFVVEPGARDPETARWWAKAILCPPKAVQAQFNLPWEPDADGFSAQAPYVNKFTSGHPADNQSTLVLTYYERPNFLCKAGKVRVVVNDQCVHKSDWPFPGKDRLNLFVGRETVVENRWTGDTVVTYARPLQTALNATESVILEHMKKAGNARLAIPQSSMDIIESLTDEPGEFIPYVDGNSKPEWMSPPQMPAWWQDRPASLMQALDDEMGVHDVSRGEAPSNIESGYGLSILVEQDTSPVGRLVKETARVWSDVASFVLSLYEAEVKTKRKSSVKQSEGAMEVEWTGKDLHGQTTAEVPEDAVLPRSRAAQLKNAQSMMEMGLITSVSDFAFMAELPDSRHMLEAVAPAIAWARQENGLFAAGHMTTVEEWEDDEAHIMEHNRYRQTMDYRLLDGKQREAVNTHIKAHETQAAEKLGKQRAKSQVDPALGMAPNAAGAGPIDPLAPPEQGLMQGQPPEMPMPGGPVEAAAAAPDVGGDMMSALQQQFP